MKVKMFFSQGGYFSKDKMTPQLECDINEWLERHDHVKVVDVRQSVSGGSLEPPCTVVSIWYEG